MSIDYRAEPRIGFVSVCCDLCGSSEQDLLFEKEGFRHVRCRICGLVFVSPRLERHIETQQCAGTGAMGEDQLTSAQIRRLRKEVAALQPYRRLNRILDVGAGRGWFLSEAKRSGWETWAIEINSDAISHLKNKGIDQVLAQPAESFEAPDASMDVIRVWDVIEHLESPSEAMGRIGRALRPGGSLRLATTNFASLSRWISGPEWVYLNGADHIFLFEPATISLLLREHGFVNVRIRTRSFNMRRKLYHPEQDLPPSMPALRPFRKLIDELMRFTRFGHQMIVTATKPNA
ncbi:MAG: methyltransferase domain-containing protein [Deltaproteobacteria bacterium]|nr:methyltransferase domain-containing protein [Deltaproteobacteria bacterium]